MLLQSKPGSSRRLERFVPVALVLVVFHEKSQCCAKHHALQKARGILRTLAGVNGLRRVRAVRTELYVVFEASRDPILAATKAELKVARAAVGSCVPGSFPTKYPMRCGRFRMNRSVLRARRHASEFQSVLPVLLPGHRSVLFVA